MTDIPTPPPAFDELEGLSTYQPAGSPIARLMAAYPHLFQNGPPEWSDCPAGWYNIACEFMDLVDRHLGPVLAPFFRIDQCKEKFGGFRVYWSLLLRRDPPVDIQLEQMVQLFVPPDYVLPGDQSPFDEDGNDVDEENDSHPPLDPRVALALAFAQQSIRAGQEAILQRSLSTCQVCAAPGMLREFAWMRTLCDACAAAHSQSHGEPDRAVSEERQTADSGRTLRDSSNSVRRRGDVDADSDSSDGG